MADVAVVTDSNSGITVEEGLAMGVTVIPMPVHINGAIYYEGLDITQEEFYAQMLQGADVATSQPAPGYVLDVWNRLLQQYRELVYIPMSAGLSASCATAQMASRFSVLSVMFPLLSDSFPEPDLGPVVGHARPVFAPAKERADLAVAQLA